MELPLNIHLRIQRIILDELAPRLDQFATNPRVPPERRLSPLAPPATGAGAAANDG